MMYLIPILIYFVILITNILILKHNTYVRDNLEHSDPDVLVMIILSLVPIFQSIAFIGIISLFLQNYIYTSKDKFKK